MSVYEMQQVTGFLASNFMKILKKKQLEKFPRSSRLLNIYQKLQKKKQKNKKQKNADIN